MITSLARGLAALTLVLGPFSFALAAQDGAPPARELAPDAPPTTEDDVETSFDETTSDAATPGPTDEIPAYLLRPDAQLARGRRGSGEPVCGLGAKFHAGRRAALRETLGSGIIIVRGLPETRDYSEFRQDKTFWYLTGIESPDATLVMDAASGLELLFLPDRDTVKEFWEGELWDAQDEWVKPLTGFQNVRPNGRYHETLMETLGELLDGRDAVWVSMHPWVALSGCFDRAGPADDRQLDDPLDGRPSREAQLAASIQQRFEVQVKDMSPALATLRLVKQPAELAAMRRAGIAGARAMAEAIRSTRPGLGEWELDALLGFEQVR